MKTPKLEPSNSDDKTRRPRPLKPASWLDEVKPDDDVMAVFYGRSPNKTAEATAEAVAPAPVVEPPPPVPVPDLTPATLAPAESKPVSRSPENRETGLLRSPEVSRGRPAPGDRETEIRETGLPVVSKPVSRSTQDRETAPAAPSTVLSADSGPVGEGHWPSRRYKARVQTRIPQSLNDELTAYCDRRGVTRDAAIDRAIRLLLAEEPVSREAKDRETGFAEFGLPVSRETNPEHHDHDEDHDKKIIMIFERETGRRFRADERNLLPEFRDTDPAIVERAIRYAVKYSREPVGSFAYCAKVIRQRASRRPEDDRLEPTELHVVASPGGPATGPAEQSRFDIRAAAARLREARRDDPTYTHDRLVDDLRAGFVVQGLQVSVEQIEDALKGLAL